ncbi:hypothetical protein Tsubulata_025683, partial [Turnera subulata]
PLLLLASTLDVVTPSSLFQKFSKLLHCYWRTILLLIDISPSRRLSALAKRLGISTPYNQVRHYCV